MNKAGTFTTRLEPRDKYLLELVSRIRGTSLARTLGDSIRAQVEQEEIPVNKVWHPVEWRRLIAMASLYPVAMTHLDECRLSVLMGCTNMVRNVVMTDRLVSIELVPRCVEVLWPMICTVAERMANGEPAPSPRIDVRDSDDWVVIRYD